MTNKKKLE